MSTDPADSEASNSVESREDAMVRSDRSRSEAETTEEDDISGSFVDDSPDLLKFENDEDDFEGEWLSSAPHRRNSQRGHLAGRVEPFARMAPADIQSIRLAAMEHFRAGSLNPPQSGIASPPFCRICRDPEPEPQHRNHRSLLISPCLCKGSVAQVHVDCLERWLAESDSTCCELCGCQYKTIRTPRYNVLTSILAWAVTAGGSELLFDIFALTVFTPVALLATYLGLNADETAYFQISLMAAINMVYSAWLVMRFHYHFTRWHSWWRRKFKVKIILDKTP